MNDEKLTIRCRENGPLVLPANFASWIIWATIPVAGGQGECCPVPLRAVEDEAILRRFAQGMRLPGGGDGGTSPRT